MSHIVVQYPYMVIRYPYMVQPAFGNQKKKDTMDIKIYDFGRTLCQQMRLALRFPNVCLKNPIILLTK